MAVEIRSSEDVERWLKDRPVEVRRVLALRLAFWVAPIVFERAARTQTSGDDRLPLSACRVLAVAWSASAGYAPKEARFSLFPARAAARGALLTAGSSLTTTFIRTAIELSANVMGADAAEFAAEVVRLGAWQELNLIATRIDGGAAPVVALRDAIETPHADDWRATVSRLTAKDPNWRFWTDWYQDRLDGKPLNRACEKALLALTEEEWRQDAAVVNARLMALMNEAERAEAPTPGEQSPRGILVVYPENGPIRFAAPEQGNDLAADALVLRDEIIFEIKRLADQCVGANSPARSNLKERLARFGEAVSVDKAALLEKAAQVLIWSRAGKIQDLLDLEESAAHGEQRDDPPLPAEVLSSIKGLLRDVGIFGAHLTEFSRLNSLSGGEVEGASVEVIVNVTQILSNAPDVVEPEVTGVISDLTPASNSTSANAKKARNVAVATLNNVFVAVATRLRTAVKRTTDFSGAFAKKVAESAAAKLIVEKWDDIAPFLQSNPLSKNVLEFLEWLRSLINSAL